ncbi:MAG TPA: fasciclin domain-containing protein [Pelobium sp.]|nr:fasciclin domain-containing protein [Pelobium sp.]
MKKRFLSLAMVAVLAGATFTACNNDKVADDATDSMAMDSTAMVSEEGVMVGGAMMVPSKNIVENASGSSEHTTLVAAVTAADLAETLSGTGPFTVFAPTNAAFEALPAGTVEGLLKPDNKGKLSQILTYHVVSGAYTAADLTDGMELTTVEGGKLTVSIKDGVVMVGGATVTTADVISSNGVTHVVDAVLMPSM